MSIFSVHVSGVSVLSLRVASPIVLGSILTL